MTRLHHIRCYQRTDANMTAVGAAIFSVVAKPTVHPSGIADIPDTALGFGSVSRFPSSADASHDAGATLVTDLFTSAMLPSGYFSPSMVPVPLPYLGLIPSRPRKQTTIVFLSTVDHGFGSCGVPHSTVRRSPVLYGEACSPTATACCRRCVPPGAPTDIPTVPIPPTR